MKMKVVIWSFISFVFGLLIKHIWDRFKNRVATLKYKVEYQYMALSVGPVKILYYDAPVKNLYMTTIQMINDSNRDIENAVLKITSDNKSSILESNGYKKDSVDLLPFTKDFF